MHTASLNPKDDEEDDFFGDGGDDHYGGAAGDERGWDAGDETSDDDNNNDEGDDEANKEALVRALSALLYQTRHSSNRIFFARHYCHELPCCSCSCFPIYVQSPASHLDDHDLKQQMLFSLLHRLAAQEMTSRLTLSFSLRAEAPKLYWSAHSCGRLAH